MVMRAIIAEAGETATRRFLEFLAATIRNKNTRMAYYRAVRHFFAWSEHHQLGGLDNIEPLHVAAYVEQLQGNMAKPSVKQHLSAIRMLFHWLVTGQVLATNPAHAVRGPKHAVKRGKTPVLTIDQAREMLDSIDTSTLIGLRDRALIGVMNYAFARISALSPCASKTTSPRASAGGCVCTRKAASRMKCRRITSWKPSSTSTSRRPASWRPGSHPYSARPWVAPARSASGR